MLRRYIAPQKDVLSSLRTTEIQWIETIHRRQLHENQDRLTRYVEDLDAIRERAQIVKDELVNALNFGEYDEVNKRIIPRGISREIL